MEIRDENKRDIKKVTKTLILKEGYAHVNISEISKGTNIKRGAIYNYYQKKEDIYLDLLNDEINIYLDELINIHIENKTNKEFIDMIVDNLEASPIILILLPIMLPIIEPEASLEGLTNFKKEYSLILEKFFIIFKRKYPKKDDNLIYNNILTFASLINGFYPMSNVSKKQKEAIKKSKIKYEQLDFSKVLKYNLEKIL